MLNRHDCSSSPFPCVHTVCTKHEESIVTFWGWAKWIQHTDGGNALHHLLWEKSILSYTTNAHPRHTDVFEQTQMPCHGSHHIQTCSNRHRWSTRSRSDTHKIGDQQQQDRRTTDTHSNTVSNTTTSIIDYYVHNVFLIFPTAIGLQFLIQCLYLYILGVA